MCALCRKWLSNREQRANPPEAEQIVDTIVKCCQDPAYKGKTFGVISLLSSAPQDRLIEGLLLKAAPGRGSMQEVLFVGMHMTFREMSRT